MSVYTSLEEAYAAKVVRQVITDRMMSYAMRWVGRWYKWGSDDPSGFDCSGFICEVAKAFGALSRDRRLTANGMWIEWAQYKVNRPSAGCVVLYGTKVDNLEKAEHIELCLDEVFALGASGGGSTTKTEADAIAANAFIKQRPISRNRMVLGYIDLIAIVQKFIG